MKRISALALSLFFIGMTQAQDLDMDYLKGMQARSIGPGGMSGRVTAIDVDPTNDAILYVATASGGIWKSTSGGTTFEPIFDQEAVANIGALAVDPSNPDVVWAGTGEGNPRNSLNGGFGIYKSLDAGRTWKLMGLEGTRHIHRILVHPRNPEVVYVGAIGSPWGPHAERGVYKSKDGGDTWEQVLFVNELTGVADMVMDPSNPDKLFVAMWEHQRWPWFFTSGGEGSGLHMTVDGGRNWKRLGADQGLPKGELGRMGLAIAAGNSNYVYALVESKKNAIYRSTDGGYTWEKRGEENIGSRPFYYADLYVDPQNENRLYSLFSVVNVSEDGGLTFSTLVGYNIHLDHHAWWIHPRNPDFMIDGNDGGLAITYDRGKSWRHVSNIPVSQFYHIGVDMEQPYHVYGGMQDNGSWRGPAYVWSSGGIINTYWDFLMGGDGFDVLPVPGEPAMCYGMSQQGNLRRVYLESGRRIDIKPAPEGDQKLRFHWNAALAQDPFQARTIYFGSQYVHKSEDRGDSWTRISPDLTTNDSTKQQYGESGGLTYDVTGAENHTCILAIAPSPIQEGLLWVGTDDGLVQLSRDGGESWTRVSDQMKELPEGAWIPQIVPSASNAGEAFVVVNNYRLNDYAPYLFHTTDFGETWERVVSSGDVPGYVLSFAQDPEVSALQFLGTEYGLYVSIDAGATWSKWTNGYPTVSTMDMVIHPRELDLVIGTFGRSAYVLDDIRPLRELALDYQGVRTAGVHAVDAPVAVQAERRNAPGYYFVGDAYFQGQNRGFGARISYFVNPDGEATGDTAFIHIRDLQGNQVRKLTQVPHRGLNRVTWNLDRKGLRLDFSEKGSEASTERGGGGYVMPGEYQVQIAYAGDTSVARVEVQADPRLPFDPEARAHSLARADELLEVMGRLNDRISTIRECKEAVALVEKLSGDEQSDALPAVGKSMNGRLDSISSLLFRDRSIQGIYSSPDLLSSKVSGGQSILYTTAPLTPNQMDKFRQSVDAMEEAIEGIDRFLVEEWAAYKEHVQRESISLFRKE